ncbi:hypothetical protein [uncultured Cohaesibacter sp.]|uniref:hypothetical protein n=1 Tax=uncultured Cohaesibacter sp. TaxID=1002546 RepID=UPI0029303844|nr:hypothetical protein [uncultured Cohaesibacter sp.]
MIRSRLVLFIKKSHLRLLFHKEVWFFVFPLQAIAALVILLQIWNGMKICRDPLLLPLLAGVAIWKKDETAPHLCAATMIMTEPADDLIGSEIG